MPRTHDANPFCLTSLYNDLPIKGKSLIKWQQKKLFVTEWSLVWVLTSLSAPRLPQLRTGVRLRSPLNDRQAWHTGSALWGLCLHSGGDEVLATTFINHGGAPAVPRASVGASTAGLTNCLWMGGRDPHRTQKNNICISTHEQLQYNIMHGPLRRRCHRRLFKATVNINTFAAQRCKILPVVHDWWQMGSALQTQTTLLPARCNYRRD